MLRVRPIDLDEVSPNAAPSVRCIATRRAIAILCSARVPSTLMSIVLLVLSCYALLTVKGIGLRSWQAALCSPGALETPSCRRAPVGSARVASSVVQVGAR